MAVPEKAVTDAAKDYNIMAPHRFSLNHNEWRISPHFSKQGPGEKDFVHNKPWSLNQTSIILKLEFLQSLSNPYVVS